MLSFFAWSQPWNRHLGSQGSSESIHAYKTFSVVLLEPRGLNQKLCALKKKKKPLCVSPAGETPGGTEFAGFPGSLRVLFKGKKFGVLSLLTLISIGLGKTKPMFSDANILLIARIACHLLFGSFPPSQCS